MNTVVLRLGHRLPRDERISTHVGLVARALGADKIIYTGERDHGMEESIQKIDTEWGGEFEIEYAKSGINIVRKLKKEKYIVVHLTMYGIEIQNRIKEIRNKGNGKILVIVGGSHVPKEFYESSDFNISVTTQPHSEVAALAIFLHEYFEGKELEKKFKGKKIITPSNNGKKIQII